MLVSTSAAAGLDIGADVAVDNATEDAANLVSAGDLAGSSSGGVGVEGAASGEDDLKRRASWPTSIPITSSNPSTSSFSRSFTSTYESLLASLSSTAEEAVSSAISSSLSSRLTGVPGTAITSRTEAVSLQSYLDCTSSRGEWVYDPAGAHLAAHGSGLTVHKQEGRYAACDKRFYKGREVGEGVEEGEWDVRESLKWRWVPSPSCAELARSSLSALAESKDPAPPVSRERFCRLLAHKSTLLLGDSTQYSLHDLLLDFTSTLPQSCYGDLYCKEHALCGEILRAKDYGRVEDWEEDERVYHRLPLPPSSAASLERRALHESAQADEEPEDEHDHPHPSLDKRQLERTSSRSPSYGTLLRYRRTDGLRPASAYTLPTYKHPFTGLREINQQWLADSRRSDIVVLTKSPLPLPLKGHNATWDEWVYETLEDEEVDPEDKAERLLEAAKDVTRNVWLPELLEALKAIRALPSPPDQLVVYRSGWRQHADCAASSFPSSSASDELAASSPGDGPPPHPEQPDLAALFFRPSSSSSSANERALLPVHIVFHNLQLHLQHRLLRSSILPAFGIPFLDLETPLSVWRSGMVGSSAGLPFSHPPSSSSHSGQTVLAGPGGGLRSPQSGDCTRYCFPSPGLAVEEFFLGALGRVFEAGWAGDRRREKEWTGEGFRNLRERVAEREKGGGE
ncbi:hypothetical protein JCM8097_001415 [Rhodosporidiobolus ruineniae]